MAAEVGLLPEADAAVPLIETRGLGKRFAGMPALCDVDFSARTGEVHALVGANGAGKSTLIKLLSGALQPSRGHILLNGREVRFDNPRRAQEAGIGTVYQELTLVPQLTVAENLFLGREPLRMGCWLDRPRRREDARRLLERLGFAIEPDARIDALGIADRQLVEIARALSLNGRVLILDEPTAVLSVPEQDKLFEIVHQLRGQGITVLYISHRLEEVFALSDRVSVFRDGRLCGTVDTAATTEAEIVRQMVGEMGAVAARANAPAHFPPLLEVRYVREGGSSRLRVGAGEIVGIAGFVGAGRSRLARRIAGDDEADDGDIAVTLDGRPVARRGIAHAARQGIVYVTEDRKRDGLFGPLRAIPNVSAASLWRVVRRSWLRFAQERQLAQPLLHRMRLKAESENVPVRALSGGNQQKVIFARALLQSPRLLICDEPTRGVDIGAKQEIHALMRSLATQGVGVLVISSEFAELRALCDRIAVMFEGRLVRDLPAAQASEAMLLMAASGAAKDDVLPGG